jgi:hypothetical protein
MATKGNAMPSTRKHQRYYSSAAASADVCTTARSELGAGARRNEEDLIDQTVAIWQKRTERKLTREDGREIIENITGFFTILQEWGRKERAAEQASTALVPESSTGRRTKQRRDSAATARPSNKIAAQR